MVTWLYAVTPRPRRERRPTRAHPGVAEPGARWSRTPDWPPWWAPYRWPTSARSRCAPTWRTCPGWSGRPGPTTGSSAGRPDTARSSPLRFATIYHDDGRVRDACSRSGGRPDGHAGAGGRTGPSGASRRTSTRAPSCPTRADEDGSGGDSPGTAYLLRRRAQRDDKETAHLRATERAEEIHTALAALAAASAAASAAGRAAGRVRGLDGAEQLLSGAGRPDGGVHRRGDRGWASGTRTSTWS